MRQLTTATGTPGVSGSAFELSKRDLVLLGLTLLVPVPLLGVSGLSLPLPASVERAAALILPVEVGDGEQTVAHGAIRRARDDVVVEATAAGPVPPPMLYGRVPRARPAGRWGSLVPTPVRRGKNAKQVTPGEAIPTAGAGAGATGAPPIETPTQPDATGGDGSSRPESSPSGPGSSSPSSTVGVSTATPSPGVQAGTGGISTGAEVPGVGDVSVSVGDGGGSGVDGSGAGVTGGDDGAGAGIDLGTDPASGEGHGLGVGLSLGSSGGEKE
jgi:hypothetical protein